jgi:hypothetical protein
VEYELNFDGYAVLAPSSSDSSTRFGSAFFSLLLDLDFRTPNGSSVSSARLCVMRTFSDSNTVCGVDAVSFSEESDEELLASDSISVPVQ